MCWKRSRIGEWSYFSAVLLDGPMILPGAVDRFQLSFYRNMTIHLFISEAHHIKQTHGLNLPKTRDEMVSLAIHYANTFGNQRKRTQEGRGPRRLPPDAGT